MNTDITFTTSDKLYCLHPDADPLTVVDQIHARQAQLAALLAMTKGEAGEVFRSMSDQLQEGYMWACDMLAREVLDLLNVQAELKMKARQGHGAPPQG